MAQPGGELVVGLLGWESSERGAIPESLVFEPALSCAEVRFRFIVLPTNGRTWTMLNPGDTAPDFSVTDHNGNRVSLGDFTGKTVILWFYPKADTPG